MSIDLIENLSRDCDRLMDDREVMLDSLAGCKAALVITTFLLVISNAAWFFLS